MLGKKRTTFSREDFVEKELRRSGAFGSWAVAYSTVKAYISKVKKYMRLVHSIRLTKEDIADYVTMPVDVEPDEEKEPLTKQDIIRIVNCSNGQRRNAFYL